jgi:tetratricopeptide (TPR) repeat protein
VSEEQEKTLVQLYDRFLKGSKEIEARADYDGALAMVKRAIVVRPRLAEAFYLMALLQEKLQKPAEAIQALDQAVFLKEDMAVAYLKKGQIQLSTREFSRASDAFRRALRFDRRNLSAALGLGDAFTALGRLDSAMVWYGEALAIRPGSAEALMKRGKAHFMKENYVRSLMDFEDALRADKRMAEAHFYRGRINKALRQYEKAIENFGEALDLGYSRYECAVEVGASYALLNNHRKAIKYFNTAIKEEPNKGKAYGLRGLSQLAEENYREALADLDEALKADTSMGNTGNRLELGFLKLRFNDNKGAEEQFGKALDQEPYSARGNYGLAVSQYLLGKPELAMRTFEQAFIPRRLEYDRIRKDPWMKSIMKDKAFKKLVKAYFDR